MLVAGLCFFSVCFRSSNLKIKLHAEVVGSKTSLQQMKNDESTERQVKLFIEESFFVMRFEQNNGTIHHIIKSLNLNEAA